MNFDRVENLLLNSCGDPAVVDTTSPNAHQPSWSAKSKDKIQRDVKRYKQKEFPSTLRPDSLYVEISVALASGPSAAVTATGPASASIRRPLQIANQVATEIQDILGKTYTGHLHAAPFVLHITITKVSDGGLVGNGKSENSYGNAYAGFTWRLFARDSSEVYQRGEVLLTRWMIDFFDNVSNRSGAAYVADIMAPEFAHGLIEELAIGKSPSDSFVRNESPTFAVC